mmetsp:Transcript_42983/g.69741  ORF Transcript_42983/g.69741 Transcript_42983/m.69741 type:complete len:461 (+) Transcript_42983:59-1441(+)
MTINGETLLQTTTAWMKQYWRQACVALLFVNVALILSFSNYALNRPSLFDISSDFLVAEQQCLAELARQNCTRPFAFGRPPDMRVHRRPMRESLKHAMAEQLELTNVMLRSPEKQKFVVFRLYPYAGLGNRFLAVISTFIVGMITRRAVIIDWSTAPNQMVDFDELFEQPPPKQAYFLLLKDVLKLYPSLEADIQGKQPLRFHHFKQPPWAQHLIFRSPLCIDFSTHEHEKVLLIESWHYYSVALRNNPLYRKLYDEWFEPYQVYTVLFPLLFKPKPEIQQQIDVFREQNFGEYAISLHIRTLESNKMTADHQRVFWNCADDILKTQSTLGQNYSIYIATEDACVKLEARRRYGCHAVFGIEPYSRENLQGLKNGLIDNFLLGEGDDIIVSGSSTYSNVAAARTWIVPHTVMNTPRLCVKLLHAEPVMHQWNEMLQAPDSHCIDPKEIDDMLNRDEFAWH